MFGTCVLYQGEGCPEALLDDERCFLVAVMKVRASTVRELLVL